MSVLGRLLISSAERLDLADLLSVDSYVGGDFKYLLKSFVGDSKPYVLKGFDVIDPENAIGTQSCSIRVADSVVYYPGSSAGPFFYGLPEGDPNAAPLVPELRKNAVNYVYLTFSTFNTSEDSRAFWDPDKDGGAGGEFTQDVNTESVLQCNVNVSVGSFPINTIPIAKVTVGSVVITAIQDARDMMFRLGAGGISPDPYSTYSWRSLPDASFQRTEPPTTMTAGGDNPFQGADKNIYTLKEWMDVIMTKLKELGGSTFWYEDISTFSVISGFIDSIATTFKSKGQWLHDSSTPGLLTWSEDINIKIASDPRTYILRNGNKTLADEQVAYLDLVREQVFNSNDQVVAWTNGQPYVNTVGGAIGLFANLAKGDYVKKINDPNHYFLRVEEFYDSVNLGGSTTTAANAKSIRLTSNYLGTTANDKGRYDKGVYLASDVVVSDRNQAAITSAGGNFDWLALRSDTIEAISDITTTTLTVDITGHDGTKALVTATGTTGIVSGDRITISGSTNFNGTYQIDEIVSPTSFNIDKTGGPFPNETGKTATYAIVTTAVRSTAYGLQLESANNDFQTNDTVIVAGTTNYNGSYQVARRDSTHFEIAVPSSLANETTGTATLAKIIVRAQGGAVVLVQGSNVGINDSLVANIKAFIGMTSDSQTYPHYAVGGVYNTLQESENFNSDETDNVTVRLSKLTSMMADRAQDKLIKYLPANLTTITNTTNGAAQEVTFQGPSATLTLQQPGSPGNAVVSLPSSSPGISLLVNQVAYVTIDRNNASTPSITVVNAIDLPVAENTFIIAERLSGTTIYVWDGFDVAAGAAVPVPGYIAQVVNEDRNLKLVRGGTWGWNTGAGSPVNLAQFVVGPTQHVNGSQSGSTWVGQSFTTTSSGSVNTITLQLGSSGLTGTSVTLKLWATSGGVPTGAALGTSDPIPVSSIYASPVLNYPNQVFNFSTPVPLSNSTVYAWTMDSSGVTGGTIFFNGSSGSPYAAGDGLDSTNSGTSWTANHANVRSFSVDGVTVASNSLTWSADANIQVPGFAESVNLIPAGNAILSNDGDVAYVEINRTSPGGTLTVNTSPIATCPDTAYTTIIARRTGSAVIVGSHSFLLQQGESKELDAGLSIQNRALLGSGVTEATSNPGYAARGAVNRITLDTEGALDAIARHDAEFDKQFGMFRMIAKTAGTQTRVRITGSDRVAFTGETITQSMSSLRVLFTGAEIDFATGNIYGGDATQPLSTDFSTPIGITFTPATIAANQYQWYSVAAVPSGTNADNTMNVQFNVVAGSSSGATLLAAVKPPLAGTTPLGFVAVQENSGGTGILNLLQANIAQLGVGASSPGTGLFKVRLQDVLSTTLPTGNPVTIDGTTVNAGDLVLFSNLSSNNNKIYKAVGTGTNITSWQSQFVFSGSTSPTSGDTVIVTAGTNFADAIGIFTGSIWSFNQRVRFFNGNNFWEQSSLNVFTLADNQSSPATIFSVPFLGSENQSVEYSIKRGTTKEKGLIHITTDGTTVGIASDLVTLGASTGITFSATISGSNLLLQYTSTNTGSSGTMKYKVNKWAD